MQRGRDPIHELEFLVIEVGRRLRHVYAERLRVEGLNESWIGALVHLERVQPLTQIELASRIGIRRAATGVLIEAMERAGLVTRVRTIEDKRVWLVSLTDAGLEAVEAVHRLGVELGAELRSGLSRDQRREALAILEQLRTNLVAMADGTTGSDAPSRALDGR